MLALWGALGLLPWCVTVTLRRGRLPFAALPLAFVAGIAGGLLVPALGAKGEDGPAISLITALFASALVVASLAATRHVFE
jgi:hypothetical protein